MREARKTKKIVKRKQKIEYSRLKNQRNKYYNIFALLSRQTNWNTLILFLRATKKKEREERESSEKERELKQNYT